MRSHLTDITVRALKSNDAQFKVWDKSTRGFGILVGKSKSWIVMHGAARKLKVIGRYPDMPLAAARTTAKKVLANGIPDAASLPFDEALETFLTTRPHNKPRTIADYRRLLSKHFLPSFNGRPLLAITTSQILAITDKLIRTPSEHAHAFVAAKVFFSWARSRRHIAHSPMEGLRIRRRAPLALACFPTTSWKINLGDMRRFLRNHCQTSNFDGAKEGRDRRPSESMDIQ